MVDLAEVARDSDEMMRQARRQLVRAMREAAFEGKTQAQIAAETGRSQPEVSRLLRLHSSTPLAKKVRASRAAIKKRVREAGGRNVRVFGSVATESDGPESDVDLLFTMSTPLSLMDLARLEQELTALVGAEVDLVPESALMPHLRDRVLAEAVPL